MFTIVSDEKLLRAGADADAEDRSGRRWGKRTEMGERRRWTMARWRNSREGEGNGRWEMRDGLVGLKVERFEGSEVTRLRD